MPFTSASSLVVSLVFATSISDSHALSLLPGLGSKDVYTIGSFAGSKPPGGIDMGVPGIPGVPGALLAFPDNKKLSGDGAVNGEPLPGGMGGNPSGGNNLPGTPTPPMGERASSIVLMSPRGGLTDRPLPPTLLLLLLSSHRSLLKFCGSSCPDSSLSSFLLCSGFISGSLNLLLLSRCPLSACKFVLSSANEGERVGFGELENLHSVVANVSSCSLLSSVASCRNRLFGGFESSSSRSSADRP